MAVQFFVSWEGIEGDNISCAMGDAATCEGVIFSMITVTDEIFSVRDVDDAVQDRHWRWRRRWKRVLALRDGTGWRRVPVGHST